MKIETRETKPTKIPPPTFDLLGLTINEAMLIEAALSNTMLIGRYAEQYVAVKHDMTLNISDAVDKALRKMGEDNRLHFLCGNDNSSISADREPIKAEKEA